MWGLCLTGVPGSGKIPVFGQLHRSLSRSDAFLLAHAAGASARAPSFEDMLRRWIDSNSFDLGRLILSFRAPFAFSPAKSRTSVDGDVRGRDAGLMPGQP